VSARFCAFCSVAACQQNVTDCAQPTCGCTLYLSGTYDCKGLNE
jgi:hypothetical protein